MAKYLVTGMQSYDFKDDSTGRSIKGTNIFFLDKSDTDGFMGYKTGKVSVPAGFIKAFSVFPGYYELDFHIKVGAGGKVNAVLESVQFISAIKIVEDKAASAVK